MLLGIEEAHRHHHSVSRYCRCRVRARKVTIYDDSFASVFFLSRSSNSASVALTSTRQRNVRSMRLAYLDFFCCRFLSRSGSSFLSSLREGSLPKVESYRRICFCSSVFCGPFGVVVVFIFFRF